MFEDVWEKLEEEYAPMMDDRGCWEWMGALNRKGYGIRTYYFPGRVQKNMTLHRVMYEKYKGPIPKGMLVCHSCDNPRCGNPGHLWLGTDRDNARDRESKGRGRQPAGERNGHALCSNTTAEVVRQMANAGIPRKELEEFFSLPKHVIGKIARGKTYVQH